ncbi:MAG: hypothetical protein JRL30_26105 [Deltaproteobacteria bacterium]|nr:hypothetical protein [Deltaproteobacteria bacterium]
MEFIEACLMNAEASGGDLQQRLSSLHRMGVHHLIFSDFFGLRRFSREAEGLKTPVGCLNVISGPRIESIEMLWNIMNYYDLFSIFLKYYGTVSDEDFKDALYRCFSLTDNVGCALETKAISSFGFDDIVRTVQDEFNVKQFLIQDSEGLLQPEETFRCLREIRSKVSGVSKIFYFPNNQHQLGMMNALHAMRLNIDGLAGSVLKGRCEDANVINFMDLYLLYQQKRDGLFSKRASKIVDHAFESLLRGAEEE